MKAIIRILFFLLICILPAAAYSQSPVKEKAPATTKAQKRAAKHKWKEQRKLDSEQKKAIKEHDKALQTKKTRKRMRKEKRKGEKMRQNKRDFFLVRWFKYRRH